MNTRLFTLLALLGLSSMALVSGATRHPVRQEIVEEIKKKTDKWVPKEAGHNHLKDIPIDKLNKRLGSLGAHSPNMFSFDLFG
jgi:hypothetical protein